RRPRHAGAHPLMARRLSTLGPGHAGIWALSLSHLVPLRHSPHLFYYRPQLSHHFLAHVARGALGSEDGPGYQLPRTATTTEAQGIALRHRVVDVGIGVE